MLAKSMVRIVMEELRERCAASSSQNEGGGGGGGGGVPQSPIATVLSERPKR